MKRIRHNRQQLFTLLACVTPNVPFATAQKNYKYDIHYRFMVASKKNCQQFGIPYVGYPRKIAALAAIPKILQILSVLSGLGEARKLVSRY